MPDPDPSRLEAAVRERAAARAAALDALPDLAEGRVGASSWRRLARGLRESLDHMHVAAAKLQADRERPDAIDRARLRAALEETARRFGAGKVAPEDAVPLLDGHAPRDAHGRAIRGLENARWTRDVTLGGRHLWSLHDRDHRLVARLTYDRAKRV